MKVKLQVDSLCAEDVETFREALLAGGWDYAFTNEHNAGECPVDDDGSDSGDDGLGSEDDGSGSEDDGSAEDDG